MISEWKKEFEKQEDERRENPGTNYFRSYFNGYGLKETDSGDGLVRNEFVYRGLLYCFKGEGRKRIIRKLLHLLMLLAAIGALVLCGAQQGTVNGEKLFAVPFFACALITVLRFFAVIFYIISPDNMKEFDFVRSVKRYILLSRISIITGIAGVIITLVLGITNNDLALSFFLTLASFAVFTASSFAAAIVEKENDYKIIPAGEIY